MKATKKMLSLIGAAAMAGTASAVNVTIDKVQQRYPWNGLVDIDYELDGGVSVDTQFQITVTANGKTYTASTFKDAVKRTRGKHRITWDTAADNAKFFSKNATVKMSLVDTTGTYYIFDLVNGGKPVVTNCTSEAFNSDEYKTNKLVMRKVDAQTYTYVTTSTEGTGAGATRATGSVSVDSFLVGVFEVTQYQWNLFMGTWPSAASNPTYRNARPVTNISYDMIRGTSCTTGDVANVKVDWPGTGSAVADSSFLGLLRAKIGNGYLFDLPTDRQWQCAYRAGTTTRHYDGNDSYANAALIATMNVIGRCKDNNTTAESQAMGCGGDLNTAIVGSYAANGYGLYDMAGNVWEWVLDYNGNSAADETLVSGTARFFMGGSWDDGTTYGPARFGAGSRWGYATARANSNVGFRLFSPVVD